MSSASGFVGIPHGSRTRSTGNSSTPKRSSRSRQGHAPAEWPLLGKGNQAMPDPVSEELLRLNQRLLESVAQADWATYEELCDPSLTAFEPEALGQLVEGLAFHRFYFERGGVAGPHHTTMCS